MRRESDEFFGRIADGFARLAKKDRGKALQLFNEMVALMEREGFVRNTGQRHSKGQVVYELTELGREQKETQR
jgi:hypothetical protein